MLLRPAGCGAFLKVETFCVWATPGAHDRRPRAPGGTRRAGGRPRFFVQAAVVLLGGRAQGIKRVHSFVAHGLRTLSPFPPRRSRALLDGGIASCVPACATFPPFAFLRPSQSCCSSHSSHCKRTVGPTLHRSCPPRRPVMLAPQRRPSDLRRSFDLSWQVSATGAAVRSRGAHHPRHRRVRSALQRRASALAAIAPRWVPRFGSVKEASQRV